MAELKPVWTDTYKVAWHEATTGNRASIVALCNYLQETAWNHADHLGFGFRSGNGFEKAWVVARLHIVLSAYPAWEQKVRIETWPRGYKGYLAFRDFRIFNESGVQLASATTTWLLLDSQSHRPCHLGFLDDLGIQVEPEKACGRDAPQIHQPDLMQEFGRYRVRYFDLDMYGHMNNTRFIEMLIGAYPDEWFSCHAISSLSIEYLKEGKPGDSVLIRSDGPAGIKNILAATDTIGNRTLVRAEVHWKALSDES